MPTFCRHNRFIERCPICRETVPGGEAPSRSSGRPAAAADAGTGASGTRLRGTGRRARAEGVRVRHEGRAEDDGYSSPLAPGLRASADALRLADEIAFSSARLAQLAVEARGAYGLAVDAAAAGDLDRATWISFLLAYLSPAEGESPFAGVEAVLAAAPLPDDAGSGLAELLDGVERGPRSSHVPGSGAHTLVAYAQWVRRSGGQAAAFEGETQWTAERRFARLFERLALPRLSRAARYELLVILGRLGVYDLRADSLHLGTARAPGAREDEAALAAKRIFGIGDAMLLDRRAEALAEAAGAPLEALDLALFNWSRPAPAERATLGFRLEAEPDATAAAAALGL